jgi:hypothetical protein
MKTLALAAALALGATAPVLAQTNPGSANAEQPSRAAPNTGQTSGGPANTANPSTGTTAPGMTTGSTGTATGAETRSGNSAAAGNAEQPSRAVPNTGQTSGGPAAAPR